MNDNNRVHIILILSILIALLSILFGSYLEKKDFLSTVNAATENYALSFDGIDDYIDCGSDESLTITDALSVEVWCKIERVDYFGVILSKGLLYSNPTQRDKGHYGLSISDIGSINWELCFTDDQGHYDYRISSFQPTGGFKINRWYHLTAVWDGTINNDSIQLYLDGECVDNKTAIYDQLNSPKNQSNLNIGRDAYRGQNFPPGLYFHGQLDEIRILNRSLTASEVKEDYSTQNHYPKRNGTVLWYHMDEGTGLSLEDNSGIENTGIIHGATWRSNISYSNNINGDNQSSENQFIQWLLLGLVGCLLLGIFGSLIYFNYRRSQQEPEPEMIDLVEGIMLETKQPNETPPYEIPTSESNYTQQKGLNSVEMKEYIQKIGEMRAKKKEDEEK
ncbi:MAG: LamG domain-containing protein [Promethearchaeota archaeon]